MTFESTYISAIVYSALQGLPSFLLSLLKGSDLVTSILSIERRMFCIEVLALCDYIFWDVLSTFFQKGNLMLESHDRLDTLASQRNRSVHFRKLTWMLYFFLQHNFFGTTCK